jgi:hypothetical protein
MPWRHMREWTYSFNFLDLGTRWRWVVSFTPWLLNPRRKCPRYPLDRGLGWAPGSAWRRENLHCRESNPGRPVSSSSLYWLSYSEFQLTCRSGNVLTLRIRKQQFFMWIIATYCPRGASRFPLLHSLPGEIYLPGIMSSQGTNNGVNLSLHLLSSLFGVIWSCWIKTNGFARWNKRFGVGICWKLRCSVPCIYSIVFLINGNSYFWMKVSKNRNWRQSIEQRVGRKMKMLHLSSCAAYPATLAPFSRSSITCLQNKKDTLQYIFGCKNREIK